MVARGGGPNLASDSIPGQIFQPCYYNGGGGEEAGTKAVFLNMCMHFSAKEIAYHNTANPRYFTGIRNKSNTLSSRTLLALKQQNAEKSRLNIPNFFSHFLIGFVL